MVRSLIEIATRVCCAHVDEIWDLGGLPYPLIRPILERVKTGRQLRALEESSNDIEDNSAEIWRKLIKTMISTMVVDKSFRAGILDGSIAPNWRMFEKLDAQRRQLEEESESQLIQSTTALTQQKASRSIVIADARRMPRLAKSGVKTIRSARNGPRGTGSGSISGLLGRLRRSAAADVARRQVCVPPPSLRANLGRVRRAPEAMVTEARIQAQPDYGSVKAVKERKHELEDDFGLEAREMRLLQAKRQKMDGGQKDEAFPRRLAGVVGKPLLSHAFNPDVKKAIRREHSPIKKPVDASKERQAVRVNESMRPVTRKPAMTKTTTGLELRGPPKSIQNNDKIHLSTEGGAQREVEATSSPAVAQPTTAATQGPPSNRKKKPTDIFMRRPPPRR